MKNLAPLDKFLSQNNDNKLRITKLKKRAVETMGHSGISSGQSFTGQIRLRENGEYTWIVVDGGYTMSTSPIVDFKQKSTTKMLVKTANSIYKIEVLR